MGRSCKVLVILSPLIGHLVIKRFLIGQFVNLGFGMLDMLPAVQHPPAHHVISVIKHKVTHQLPLSVHSLGPDQ